MFTKKSPGSELPVKEGSRFSRKTAHYTFGFEVATLMTEKGTL